MTAKLDRTTRTTDLLTQMVEFCQQEGRGRCYADWPEHVLRDYLEAHAQAGTLVWVNGRQGAAEPNVVQGVAVVFPVNESKLREAHRLGENAFSYKPADWTEDSVYFADFVGRGMLETLLRACWFRFPAGRSKKWFAHRRGRLVELRGYKRVLRKALGYGKR